MKKKTKKTQRTPIAEQIFNLARRPMTVREISEALDCNMDSVRNAITILMMNGRVEKSKIPGQKTFTYVVPLGPTMIDMLTYNKWDANLQL